MIRPQHHLVTASRMYPAAWKQADEFRASRGVDLPKWPAWCFLPLAGWYAAVSADAGLDRLPPHLVPDVARLAALGAWRLTQGVYRFDPQIQAALEQTTLIGEMPTDVLLRLPEWCLYIETPGGQWMGDDLHGFWVHLEWDANTERRELRLLLDCEQTLQPQILHLGPWTVTEAVDRMMSESRLQAEGAGYAMPGRDAEAAVVVELATAIQPLLALVLYLCSDEPEIEDREHPGEMPGHPRPKRTKGGWRLFPPSKPRIWAVGEALGARIRTARAARTDDPQSRSSPSPHLRRAHWHGFWRGPKAGERRFEYKWLPPIPVAAKTNNEDGS